MARYTGPACKLCRREGKKLFLKGDRCYTGKCALERRSYAPGQHGQNRKKTSEYGLQLRAKQSARRYYGVSEGQFHKYFLMAERKEGVTGTNLLQLCESRLDNIVYTAGFASSRAQARQLVNHAHFTVNGSKVDIPSYLVKVGDVIAVKDTSKSTDEFKTLVESNASRPVPKWIDADSAAMTAKVVAVPEREEIATPVEEHLIVEFYSK
ncbi:30S ribosomal protein S4 [Eubacterium coprostanoligenes]|uniref:30S ribosomal protein S4 n=1 Tax=Eubacterium coprostanoligenes TaxID=290054 RepID=UPI0023573FBC|nr:30S ribosomal protein S4 [Eubacterium coprostanoligenes]MCI6253791.1 30S ribosomal protein S4 [Eubacterium coprostanoligenes]MCI6353829.1 30S ribosomal protein S4 [Eubacterium coprostanoligenes]MCI6360689.1 30S ribosomal protein S4 [Eubacterium coprostanoligenes]MCI7265173.1 30S ribosomal protein S4 [Eubacterium coprostanoligenes]MDD7358598.1 30S ribosomal protein S4 [Eubacterium coprostanoligenes]